MVLFVLLFAFVVFASAQQHPQIPCGLPPFVDRMSDASATKLRQIWQNFRSGTECSAEQQRTFALVHSLSDSERTHVFGIAPPTKPATTQQDTVPLFLRNSDAKFRQQFEKLWRSNALSDEDKFNTLETLARNNLNSVQLNDFHNWFMAVKGQKKAIDDRIDNLSGEARQILAAVTQLRAQEQKLLAQMNPSVAAELKGLL